VWLPLLTFAPIWLQGHVFVGRDLFRVYFPLKAYWSQRVRAGEWPTWFPFDGLGEPFLPLAFASPLHPASVLYLALSPPVATMVLSLAAFVLAVWGTERLGRELGLGRGPSLMAGVAFAFSGYMLGITNNFAYLFAAATVPLALESALRLRARVTPARVLWAAMVLASILLAGDPQCFAVTAGLVGVGALLTLRVSPRAALAMIGSVLLSVLLAAPQWAPAWASLTGSTVVRQTLDVSQTWSLHPAQLLDFLLGPTVLLAPVDRFTEYASRGWLEFGQGDGWVPSVALATPFAMLAAFGAWTGQHRRLGRLALGLALAVLLLAFGKHLPLYRWVYALAPPWRPFRYPVKLLPFFALGVAVAAAAGAGSIRSLVRRRRLAVLVGASAVVLLVLAASEAFTGTLGARLTSKAPHAAELAPLLGHLLARAFGLAALSLGLFWALLRYARWRPLVLGVTAIGWAQVVLPVLPALEHAEPALVEVPRAFPQAVLSRNAALEPLAARRTTSLLPAFPLTEHSGLSRVEIMSAAHLATLAPVSPALWGIEGAERYLPTVSDRFDALRSSALWLTRYSPLYSVRYAAVEASSFLKMGGSASLAIAELPELDAMLLENRGAVPRAYLARAICVPGPAEALRWVHEPRRDLQAEAVVECGETPGEDAPAGERGSVRVLPGTPERASYEVVARVPSLLVLTDAWYVGWSAEVDGQPRPILRTNFAVRGIRVEPGSHRVLLTYIAPGWRTGLVIFALTLAAWLAWAVAARFRVARAAAGRPSSGTIPSPVGSQTARSGR
jgi:hypothetical protein